MIYQPRCVLFLFLFSLILPLRGAVVVGSSHDVTGTTYAGPINQIQFKPVLIPQGIGTNTIWPVTVIANVTNGFFSPTLATGFYSVSPVSVSVFGPSGPHIIIFVPPDTNIYQFNQCSDIALSLGRILQTNPPPAINAVGFTNANASSLFGSGIIPSQFLPTNSGTGQTNWPSDSITNSPWVSNNFAGTFNATAYSVGGLPFGNIVTNDSGTFQLNGSVTNNDPRSLTFLGTITVGNSAQTQLFPDGTANFGNNIQMQTSGNILALSWNGKAFGSAAFLNTNVFDLAGSGSAAALAATNGLGGAAFKGTNAFDLAGTAVTQVNTFSNALPAITNSGDGIVLRTGTNLSTSTFVTNGAVFYVTTNATGSGIKGRLDKPYSLTAAQAAAVSGDTIRIEPGDYTATAVTNSFCNYVLNKACITPYWQAGTVNVVGDGVITNATFANGQTVNAQCREWSGITHFNPIDFIGGNSVTARVSAVDVIFRDDNGTSDWGGVQPSWLEFNCSKFVAEDLSPGDTYTPIVHVNCTLFESRLNRVQVPYGNWIPYAGSSITAEVLDTRYSYFEMDPHNSAADSGLTRTQYVNIAYVIGTNWNRGGLIYASSPMVLGRPTDFIDSTFASGPNGSVSKMIGVWRDGNGWNRNFGSTREFGNSTYTAGKTNTVQAFPWLLDSINLSESLDPAASTLTILDKSNGNEVEKWISDAADGMGGHSEVVGNKWFSLGSGPVIQATNGTQWRLVVSTNGAVSSVAFP